MRGGRFRSRLRRAAILSVLIAAPLSAGCQHAGSDAASGAASGAASDGPPVVLISIDTLRADHVGAYGYAYPTSPAIDALARDSVRFDPAIVQFPHTLMSHMSMLTSLYPAVHRVTEAAALAPYHTTLAQVFHRAGYDTAAFVRSCKWLNAEYGFDRGFDSYLATADNAAARTAAVLKWLDERREPERAVVLQALQIDDRAIRQPGHIILSGQQPGWNFAVQGGRSLTVHARGVAAAGAWPRMEVGLDHQTLATWEVSGPDFTPYTVPMPEKGSHLITVTLLNPGGAERPTDKPDVATRNRPFFLFVHDYDVHSDWKWLPYDSPPPFDRMFYPDYAGSFTGCDEAHVCASRYLGSLLATHRALAEDDLRYVRALYDGGIRFTDTQIGALIEGLKTRGIYDDALIVLTADHGEEIQDHGSFLHHQLYDEVVRVPLIVKFPHSAYAGSVVREPVESIDIMPSILEVAGLSVPPAAQGRSFLPLVQNRPVPARVAFTAGDAARTKRWKLIDNHETGKSEVYDLDADPGERHPLDRGGPGARGLRSALGIWTRKNKALAMAMARDAAPAAAAQSRVNMTEAEKERLRNLGYKPE